MRQNDHPNYITFYLPLGFAEGVVVLLVMIEVGVIIGRRVVVDELSAKYNNILCEGNKFSPAGIVK